jgi:GNAT superfamily N-acetyltransferase
LKKDLTKNEKGLKLRRMEEKMMKNISIKYSKFSKRYIKIIMELENKRVLENITYGLVASEEEGMLKKNNDYFYIALNGKNVIGYIIGEIIEKNIYNIFPKDISFLQVNDIYILKEYRNKGIGEKLLKIIEEKAKTNGIMHVLISTATKDAETIKRFYDRNGYRTWTQIFFKDIE